MANYCNNQVTNENKEREHCKIWVREWNNGTIRKGSRQNVWAKCLGEKLTGKFNGCFLDKASLGKNFQIIFWGLGGLQPCYKNCVPQVPQVKIYFLVGKLMDC